MAAKQHASVLNGAVAGAVGGILGSAAMVGFNHLLGAAGFGESDRGGRQGHRRDEAEPNEIDGTISDEPASVKVTRLAGERLTGAPLTERQERIGGLLVHHAFGALVGGIYGAAAARTPAIASGAGLPYGATVWLTADETGLPLVGLARNPATYPAERHAAAFASHLVFGLTVEMVRRLLIRLR